MNIALIRQRYTAFGGAERFVARAMQALAGEGARLTLLTREWQEGGEFEPLVCNPFYIGSLWRDLGFASSVCRTLQSHSFDLVQSHERIPCCDVYRAGDGVHREWLRQRCRNLGIPGRAGIRLNPYHYYVMAAEKKLFANPGLKAVICNSYMVKREIRHYFGLPASRLHVIYNGVDASAFHPALKTQYRQSIRLQYGIPEDAVLFLLVGSGFERKGVPQLLRAMEMLPDNVYLMVVGKDRKLAAYRKASRRVIFTGGQREVTPFYGAADAFVLPTLYDPFPNAALEAMACGLPVITSFKSGAAELLKNGEGGLVCDALDLRRLVEHMQALAVAERRARMGEAARKTAEALSQEKMVEQLLALYRQLVPHK